MDWKALATVDEIAPTVEAEIAAVVEGRPPHTPWRIANIAQADWALRQVGEARARLGEYDDIIAKWQDARRRIERAGAYLTERLQEWAVEQRTDAKKSFPLAHGTITTRQTGDAIEVVDEGAAVEWALKNCPLAVKTTRSILMTPLKESLRIGLWAIHARAVDTGGVVHEEWFDPAVDPESAEYADRFADRDLVEVVPTLIAVVVDGAGRRVPGFGVRPGKTTATVGAVLL